MFGDQVTLIALPLVAVLVLHAGAAQMGYLTAAGLAPNLLFALHAGAWVDRHGRRRRVMIAADLGRAALLAGIPLAYALGVLSLSQLFVVSFAVGTLSVLFSVSYSTLFVSLVPRAGYVEATSLLNGSRAFSSVAGPSVGGLLVQAVAAPFALAVDAVSFVVSALFLGGSRRWSRRRQTRPAASWCPAPSTFGALRWPEPLWAPRRPSTSSASSSWRCSCCSPRRPSACARAPSASYWAPAPRAVFWAPR